ncbi:MAG: MetQ/NlpA family ABC transporter substrate-binding protein [Tetragenococcus halophilus]|uniref:Lipoprotein n=1 Tax=Tetragenococcus halophilus TaxID=51669 RepID=A0A3G5FLH3_TETHA|nr:MetQ/NlpA family ABC transporter substrate-binding protein [Tetragenococcus halophilus]AYW50998.1 methionine ABC transporter substrate-binding protein [Tetragenococcus halophilus]MCO8285269.1 MetQ/NlpA family ABC transporter substrate-binding protein [Tetragenococcus halophilus]MCO8287381.1 MetQ/NlpA family ABC transporter substrate-binding protein [Tetragenococcus halophilus]MCO8292004.1 MetQ/NlpA family ABC transporter substrate-binding protein [Tetragenococcus halophilus]MCO8296267.1 Met
MKKGWKKIITGFLAIASMTLLGACGAGNDNENSEDKTVRLGVVGENNEDWEYVQEELKEKEDINLEIVTFTDYRTPITALEDGSIDLHTSLTEIFMDEINEEGGFSNTTIAYTNLNPLGIFSDKIEDVEDLEDEAEVALPNDVSNESRALLLLQQADLIELDEDKGNMPTTNDITANPKNLQFEELDANQTIRSLDDVDIACVNNNVAVDAGYIPTEDAIFLEPVAESSKPYYNVIAAREDEQDNEIYQTVVDYYQTDEVKEVIDDMTQGSSIPVW